MSAHTLSKRRAIPILVVALAFGATPVASATTPSWYPQLRLAVLDTGDAGAAISTCPAPRAGKPKAGHSCAVVGASDESADFNRVSVFAETGATVGPCRRLLFKLDHTAIAGAAKALTFATSARTMAKEVRGRRSLAQAAKHLTADFAALKHCLHKSLRLPSHLCYRPRSLCRGRERHRRRHTRSAGARGAARG
jgi:hypothetical protein